MKSDNNNWLIFTDVSGLYFQYSSTTTFNKTRNPIIFRKDKTPIIKALDVHELNVKNRIFLQRNGHTTKVQAGSNGMMQILKHQNNSNYLSIGIHNNKDAHIITNNNNIEFLNKPTTGNLIQYMHMTKGTNSNIKNWIKGNVNINNIDSDSKLTIFKQLEVNNTCTIKGNFTTYGSSTLHNNVFLKRDDNNKILLHVTDEPGLIIQDDKTTNWSNYVKIVPKDYRIHYKKGGTIWKTPQF